MAVRRKTVLWSLAALAAVAALALPKLMDGGDEAGPGGAPPGAGGRGGGGGGRGGAGAPLVATVAVVRQEPLEDVVAATGTLLPWEAVDVSVEVAGRIVSLGFQEGAYVRRGQTLAVLDASVLDAELRAARTRYDLAAVQARRQRELYAIGGLSRQALEASESEVRVLEAQMAQSRAEIARRRIVAPFSGKVGLRSVSVGAYVSPGTPLASLQMTNPLRLEFAVPEAYATRVRLGSAVTFSVPGEEGTFEGAVYAVEPGVDQTTRSLTVRARVGNAAGALTPGAFANVQLALERVEDALVAPPAAVVPGVDSAAVFVVAGGKASRRAVQTGIRTADRVQVTGPVAAGDTVLTSGVDQVRPGQAIRVAGAGRPRPGVDSARAGTSPADAAPAPSAGAPAPGAAPAGRAASPPAANRP